MAFGTIRLLIALVALVAACAALLSDGGVLEGGYLVEMHNGHDSAALMRSLGNQATMRLAFNYSIFQGLSLQFGNDSHPGRRARQLGDMTGVKEVWPLGLSRLHDSEATIVPGRREKEKRSSRPYAPHVMAQIDKLHAEGITGKGIKIALVDSGIDYTHPSLGGCFGRKCLVSFGTDLVGDKFTGHNTPEPDDDPMDCNGHGTHIAGVVAARPNTLGFLGAAPGVRLGAYRVLGCTGRTSSDVVIMACLQAWRDGADIISVSVGMPGGWSEKPLAAAVSRIAQMGVPVLASASNDGLQGQFYTSTPSDGHGVAAVTSFDSTVVPSIRMQGTYWVRQRTARRTSSSSSSSSSLSSSSSSLRRSFSCPSALRRLTTCYFGHGTPFTCEARVPAAWPGVRMPLFATTLDPLRADDACDALPSHVPNLAGYVVLVRLGGCGTVVKAKNIAKRGGRRMILYGPEGVDQPQHVSHMPYIWAVAVVDSWVGETWMRLLAEGDSVQVRIRSNEVELMEKENTDSAHGISIQSSWGPTFEMDVKPQFGAPGGLILSTYPVVLGSFAVLSGTSMACPLAAAIYALIFEARAPDRPTPRAMTGLLSTTARPQHLSDGFGTFFAHLAPVSQQGAGLVHAHDAARATTLVSPPSLSFNDTDNAPPLLKFVIVNKSTEPVRYTLGQRPAVTTYTLGLDAVHPMELPNNFADASATLSLARDDGVPVRRVTVQPGGRVIIDVTPHPPAGLDPRRLALWSGYITIKGSDNSVLSLPYQGLTGSLRAAVVLPRDQVWMASSEDPTSPVPPGTVFTLPASGTSRRRGSVVPLLCFNLVLGTAHLRAFVVSLTSGVAIGQHDMFPSFWNSRGTKTWEWNGELHAGGYAPAGAYKIVLKALRIYGDVRTNEDWDVAETQAFDIRYE